jgi:hypothetical protein
LGETVGGFAKSLWKSKSVVEYLGRYTHKIAISNHRIQSVNQNVTLGTRIISKRAKEKYEFNPRRIHTAVFLHILPKRFVKIRHYGFFEQYLEVKAKAFATKQSTTSNKVAAGSKIRKCQCCKTGNLHTILVLISEDHASFLGSKAKSIPHKSE